MADSLVDAPLSSIDGSVPSRVGSLAMYGLFCSSGLLFQGTTLATIMCYHPFPIMSRINPASSCWTSYVEESEGPLHTRRAMALRFETRRSAYSIQDWDVKQLTWLVLSKIQQRKA
jgi:hypothetical protein